MTERSLASCDQAGENGRECPDREGRTQGGRVEGRKARRAGVSVVSQALSCRERGTILVGISLQRYMAKITGLLDSYSWKHRSAAGIRSTIFVRS